MENSNTTTKPSADELREALDISSKNNQAQFNEINNLNSTIANLQQELRESIIINKHDNFMIDKLLLKLIEKNNDY
tara:strand:+ start:8833 stop:9060 length:228 start_codon:yes stop_codon:yes gene_type:complete